MDGVLYTADMKNLICYPAGRTGECKVNLEVKNIVTEAFAGSNASSIILSDSVKKICERAFKDSKITSIRLSKSVYQIKDEGYSNVFVNCSNLRYIAVDSDNKIYKAEDGVLYRHFDDEVYLECYPSAREGNVFNVPKNVSIDRAAFSKCRYLKDVKLPEKLGKLIDGAFYKCKGINLYIPKKEPVDLWDCYGPFIRCDKQCFVYVYKNSDAYDKAKHYKWPMKIRK